MQARLSINHGKLFRLLLQRGMPPLIVRFLINFNVNQSINKHRSESFGCLNGVKQGGVLSPILFTVYIDELLMKLRSSGFGRYIDDTFVGALVSKFIFVKNGNANIKKTQYKDLK